MTTMVIDDFYPDPMAVRTTALSLEYTDARSEGERSYYRGQLSTPNHAYSQLGLDILADLLNRNLAGYAPQGEFRILPARKREEKTAVQWIHVDSAVAPISAIVFLNPPVQCKGGVAFFHHREFDISRLPSPMSVEGAALMRRTKLEWKDIAARLVEDGYEPEHHWDQVDLVTMKFNRCVIFDARLFHARTHRFGETKYEARLTQNYFLGIPTVW